MKIDVLLATINGVGRVHCRTPSHHVGPTGYTPRARRSQRERMWDQPNGLPKHVTGTHFLDFPRNSGGPPAALDGFSRRFR